MNNLTSKAIKVIPVLAFLVAFALSATRVRTAALLLPCEEQTPVRVTNADRHLRKALGPEGFKLPKDTGWTVLGQRGDKDAWEKNWEVRLDMNAAEFLKLIDAKLSKTWTKISGDADPEGATSVWQFSDGDGKQWNAVAAVESEDCGSHTFRFSIKLARTIPLPTHSAAGESCARMKSIFQPAERVAP